MKQIWLFTLVLGFIILATPIGIIADQKIIWTKNMDLAADSLSGIAYGNGRYVAVGNDGTIRVSDEGTAWSFIDPGTRKDLSDIAWDGSQFIVVGDNGTILSSANGLEWQHERPGVDSDLQCIVWDGGRFVVVGWYGVRLISKNGTNWTLNESKTNLHSVASNGKTVVAIGEGVHDLESSVIETSIDGVKWTSKTYNDWLFNVTWVKNKFIITGSGFLLESSDGEIWTKKRIIPYPDGKTRSFSPGDSFFIPVINSLSLVTTSSGPMPNPHRSRESRI